MGVVDEDLEVQPPATRAYWEDRSSREVLAIVKYNKHFIGLARKGKADNFVVFQPWKQWLRIGLAWSQSEENTAALEGAGLKPEYDAKWRRYVLNLEPGGFGQANAAVRDILAKALEEWR